MSCVLGSRFALPKRNALVGDRSNRASRSIGHPTKRMIHIVVPAGNLFGIVNQTSVADYAARMRTSDQQMSGGASASCRPELPCPNRARMCPDYRHHYRTEEPSVGEDRESLCRPRVWTNH